MDARVIGGAIAVACALYTLWLMEPVARRFVRMKFNSWRRRRQRDRATSGFEMRRSNAFRDGGLL